MKWFSSSAIVLDITPDRITFTDMDGEVVSLAPFIRVEPSRGRLRILTAGNPPSAATAGIEVALFRRDSPPIGISKMECLTALFRAGLKQLVDRMWLRLRPEVLVYGVDTLSGVLGGYERDLITAALLQAGARAVRWPDAP